jgi:VIT1/CCC1 family predicted Fe2+/Mn2+ transporter
LAGVDAQAVGESVYKAPRRLFSFVGETLSLGDRLSELLYGVLMVSSISGLIVFEGYTEVSDFYYMLIVLFITITLWGVLDGVSYALLSAANRAERETLVESLQVEGDSEKRRKAIGDELDGTLITRLDEETQSKIFEIVEKGLPRDMTRMTKNALTSYEKRIILAAFLLDFAALVILVIPYLFFDTIAFAALISHSIALVMFVIIGFYYAKYAHLNKWKGAFVCGLLGLLLIVFAESTNLVLI